MFGALRDASPDVPVGAEGQVVFPADRKGGNIALAGHRTARGGDESCGPPLAMPIRTPPPRRGLWPTPTTLGQHAAAIRVQRLVVESYQKALGPTDRETANAKAQVGDFLVLDHGDAREALRLCTTALETLDQGPPNAPFRLVARLGLANAHLTLGNYRVADSSLSLVRPVIDTGPGSAGFRGALDSRAALVAAGLSRTR